MKDHQRRHFLKLGAQTLTGAGLALGGNPMLTLARAADGSLGASGDYRALVCVYLAGGCDGFSLMVPTSSAGFDEYARSRSQLAWSRGSVLDLQSSDGASALGLHQSAVALKPLYESGRLAMIANLGNLVEPTSREQYENRSVALPAQLFSHNDQTIQWQQLQGRGRATDGWGALAADYLSAYQERDYLTSISLAGTNYWQSGYGQRPFSMTDAGVLEYAGMDPSDNWQAPLAESFGEALALKRDHMITTAYADLQKRAMQVTTELGQVLESSPGLANGEPEGNTLAKKLGMVAKLINVQQQLGMRRQIFYVRMDGFDVHDNQRKELPDLFRELTEALAFFQGELDSQGRSESVTTFTASDFGRTLTSNGDGTDHGWGNHLFAMGGAVQGGRVYGTVPSLDVEGPDQVHNGRILPTLSSTQYAATLLRWLGLDEQQLDAVLPNLARFPTRNLGFLNA